MEENEEMLVENYYNNNKNKQKNPKTKTAEKEGQKLKMTLMESLRIGLICK